MEEADEQGNRIVGDTLMLLLNAGSEKLSFKLPEVRAGRDWQLVRDTYEGEQAFLNYPGGDSFQLNSHSTAILRVPSLPPEGARLD